MIDAEKGRFIADPLLTKLGVAHGFGTIGAASPEGLKRPKQVHGVEVAELSAQGELSREEADATVSLRPETPIGVITADCVPILMVAGSGGAVAAVHAGWRGLAAGVVSQALVALTRSCDEPVTAAIGPHAGSCCYEVDSPVIEAFSRAPFRIDAATVPTRPGHFRLNLESLVVAELRAGGVARDRIGTHGSACTICHPSVFESFRRDGAESGRMVHWITARLTGRSQP